MRHGASGVRAQRVSRGAARAEITACLLVQGAAVARVLLPLALPSAYAASVALSAALWSAAFAVFVVAYFPILSRPRLDGHSG